jgi:hypothetical protein
MLQYVWQACGISIGATPIFSRTSQAWPGAVHRGAGMHIMPQMPSGFPRMGARLVALRCMLAPIVCQADGARAFVPLPLSPMLHS